MHFLVINYAKGEKNREEMFVFPRKTKMNFRNASIYRACGESLSPPYLGFPERLNQILFLLFLPSFLSGKVSWLISCRVQLVLLFCAFSCDPTSNFPKKKHLNDIVPRLPNSLIYCVPRGRKRDPFRIYILAEVAVHFFYLGKEGEDREEEISEIEKSETGTAFPEN